MKVDRTTADGLAAMLRSAELIDIGSALRRSGSFDQQSRLTENLFAISRSLRSLSAMTRENACQIRAYGKTLRTMPKSIPPAPVPSSEK